MCSLRTPDCRTSQPPDLCGPLLCYLSVYLLTLFLCEKTNAHFPWPPFFHHTQNELVCICCCGLLFYLIVPPLTYAWKYIFRLVHSLPDTLTPIQLSGCPQTSTSICILWCSTSVFPNYLSHQGYYLWWAFTSYFLFPPLQSSPSCFRDQEGTQRSYVMRKKHDIFLGRDARWKQCVTGIQEQATDEERQEWWCLPHCQDQWHKILVH